MRRRVWTTLGFSLCPRARCRQTSRKTDSGVVVWGGRARVPDGMPDIHIATQAEGEAAAKRWRASNGGGDVFGHRDEGEFSRIRKGDAVDGQRSTPALRVRQG